MRLLRPGGAAGLKTLHDIGGAPWYADGARAAAAAGLTLTSTWEVATVSSRRRLGSQGLRHSFALYHALGTIARVNAMTDFVAVLDDRVRRLLDSVGLVTRPIPGTRPGPYLGSASSTPVFANVNTMLRAQRRDHPESFALVTVGTGLDGVAVPADSEFRIAPAAETIPTRGWRPARSSDRPSTSTIHGRPPADSNGPHASRLVIWLSSQWRTHGPTASGGIGRAMW